MKMFSKPLLLTLLTAASSASASPLLSRRSQILNTATCTGHSAPEYFWALYSVSIGVWYDNGHGCGGIQNHLTSALGSAPQPLCGLNTVGPRGGRPLCNFKCETLDGGASTLLEFEVSLAQGGKINKALAEMYPMVAGGFSCPDIMS